MIDALAEHQDELLLSQKINKRPSGIPCQ